MVARNGSPLIIGVGDREMHVASDLAALVRYTTTVAHLDDGELATVTASGFTTYKQDRDLVPTAKRATEVDVDPEAYDAGRPRVVHAQGDPASSRRRPSGRCAGASTSASAPRTWAG